MTRPVLILLPVLGLTWLCGVLVHLSMAVAYAFIILNAFQVSTATPQDDAISSRLIGC